MKINVFFLLLLFTLFGCTSQKKLAYLNNLDPTMGDAYFVMEIPEYYLQHRDNIYITAKALNPDGVITDFFSSSINIGGTASLQGETGQFLFGYEINKDGKVALPVVGEIAIAGMTLESATDIIQMEVNKVFKNTTVECKLLSFKFTVIGEVRAPGTYINFNNYLTVLEAIGRAGGISDFGRRDKILVIRPVSGGTKSFTVNLQDKSLFSSEAYFLLPNDVLIIEPESKKIFNMNLPTISFIVATFTSAITTTLLLINYLK